MPFDPKDVLSIANVRNSISFKKVIRFIQLTLLTQARIWRLQ